MALQIDKIIGQHIVKGVISIPHGVAAQYSLPDQFLNRYTIYEGAVNNIPDEGSLKATKEIENMVANLKNDDLLFVLVSGIRYKYKHLSVLQLDSFLIFHRRRFCIVGIPS